jgi:hypothetical protein
MMVCSQVVLEDFEKKANFAAILEQDGIACPPAHQPAI